MLFRAIASQGGNVPLLKTLVNETDDFLLVLLSFQASVVFNCESSGEIDAFNHGYVLTIQNAVNIIRDGVLITPSKTSQQFPCICIFLYIEHWIFYTAKKSFCARKLMTVFKVHQR